MNKIIKTDKGFSITNGEIENHIHIVHCSEIIEEIKKDLYDPYVVYEYVTNSPRLHLLTACSQDNALEQVYEYLLEQENNPMAELLGVEQVEM